MEAEERIEHALAEIKRSAQELLEWSQSHPGMTLRELEEKVQAWKQEGAAKVLGSAVALRGEVEEVTGECDRKALEAPHRAVLAARLRR